MYKRIVFCIFLCCIIQGCFSYDLIQSEYDVSGSKETLVTDKLYEDQCSQLSNYIAKYCIQDYKKHFNGNSELVQYTNSYSYYAYARMNTFLFSPHVLFYKEPYTRIERKKFAIRVISQGKIYAVTSSKTGDYNEEYDVINEQDLEKTILKHIKFQSPKPDMSIQTYLFDTNQLFSVERGTDTSNFVYKKIPVSAINTTMQLGYYDLITPNDMTSDSVEQAHKDSETALTLALLGIEDFIIKNPFYYQKSETLFREWAQNAIVEEISKAMNTPYTNNFDFYSKFSQLNTDEQFEVKQKISLFIR